MLRYVKSFENETLIKSGFCQYNFFIIPLNFELKIRSDIWYPASPDILQNQYLVHTVPSIVDVDEKNRWSKNS
jgi:hypothetical protein